MTKFRGIYAASVSILDSNLGLDVSKTVSHIERLIENGCHGVAIFGSTGQSQLISVSEKINLINHLSESKYKKNYLIGTGFNSLSETINFIKIAQSLRFNDFLIMPPAYYKYGDDEVINFYSRIIDSAPDCKIILYNFEKLCGYKFSISCVERLVKEFPKQIAGVKDSTYNLYENLKINNFSVLPGSEEKLLKGLELGCDGIITATCNVTATLARKVYEDFLANNTQTQNEKLCNVRKIFDQYNLISALHTFLSDQDRYYKNLLPPLGLLKNVDKNKLIEDLNKSNFNLSSLKAD